MSDEKIEVIRKAMAAISRRDLPGFLEHLDADIQLDPLTSVWPRTYRGHEGIEQWWRDVAELWEHFVVHPEDFRDRADKTVIVQISWRGRGKGAFAEVEGPATAVVRFRDTKVASIQVHFDETRAMQAIADTPPG